MKLSKLFKSAVDDELFMVCKALLTNYKVNYSQSQLRKSLSDHIDYPSLLAIKDVLGEYGIESLALRKGSYSYPDFETPFICSIQQENWPNAYFTLVSNVTNDEVTYLDPVKNLNVKVSLTEFNGVDKGIILLTDDMHKKDEVNLQANLSLERGRKLVRNIPLYLGILVLLFSLGYSIIYPLVGYTWFVVGFTLTSFVGMFISTLLVWHEVDAHNPFIREVCGGQHKKRNCDAVLNSSQSDFLGVSWAVWGFSFMATLLINQIFFPSNITILYIHAILSVVAFPYVIFSIYYQWKVVKQWCPLCLSIQVVLIANALIAITLFRFYDFDYTYLSNYSLLLTAIIGLSFLIAAYVLIPILKQSKDNQNFEKKWKKLKYNPDVFQSLLSKSEAITIPVDHLGIVVGDPTAQHEIIKVCNPYCGPCAKAHPELEELIQQKSNVKVRIIFTASGEDHDMMTAPVQHLLAIQERDGRKVVHQALDDWYLAPTKDYDQFAQKYLMNGELTQQKEKMIAMRNWCDQMKIRATPTIFVNGRELPDSYSVKDLKYFF